MRTINPRTEHWVSEPRLNVHTGEITARGVSSWDMPDGARLRREMSRSTILEDMKAMLKWARRYKVDVTRQIAKWHELEAQIEAQKIDAAIQATPNLVNPELHNPLP